MIISEKSSYTRDDRPTKRQKRAVLAGDVHSKTDVTSISDFQEDVKSQVLKNRCGVFKLPIKQKPVTYGDVRRIE